MATTQAISFPTNLAEELSAAATAASMTSSGTTRHIQLADSELPSLVPSGSLLKVRATKFSVLNMGDLICVRVNGAFAVRRFVKTKFTNSDTYILVAHEGNTEKEVLPRNCLLGKIEAINAGGKTYNPLASEGPIKRFWGKLTEYGTHKPFGLG